MLTKRKKMGSKKRLVSVLKGSYERVSGDSQGDKETMLIPYSTYYSRKLVNVFKGTYEKVPDNYQGNKETERIPYRLYHAHQPTKACRMAWYCPEDGWRECDPETNFRTSVRIPKKILNAVRSIQCPEYLELDLDSDKGFDKVFFGFSEPGLDSRAFPANYSVKKFLQEKFKEGTWREFFKSKSIPSDELKQGALPNRQVNENMPVSGDSSLIKDNKRLIRGRKTKLESDNNSSSPPRKKQRIGIKLETNLDAKKEIKSEVKREQKLEIKNENTSRVLERLYVGNDRNKGLDQISTRINPIIPKPTSNKHKKQSARNLNVPENESDGWNFNQDRNKIGINNELALPPSVTRCTTVNPNIVTLSIFQNNINSNQRYNMPGMLPMDWNAFYLYGNQTIMGSEVKSANLIRPDHNIIPNISSVTQQSNMPPLERDSVNNNTIESNWNGLTQPNTMFGNIQHSEDIDEDIDLGFNQYLALIKSPPT